MTIEANGNVLGGIGGVGCSEGCAEGWGCESAGYGLRHEGIDGWQGRRALGWQSPVGADAGVGCSVVDKLPVAVGPTRGGRDGRGERIDGGSEDWRSEHNV